MTAIVVASSGEESILVADRRLTANGVLTDDDAGKGFLVVVPDGRLMMAFTGLARAGAFDTRQWILQETVKILPEAPTLAGYLHALAAAANQKFRRLRIRRSAARLTIVACGYIYIKQKSYAITARVSNFEHAAGVLREPGAFEVASYRLTPESPGHFIGIFGTSGKMFRSDIEGLDKLAARKVPYAGLIAYTISAICRHAESPESAGTVGTSCSAIAMRWNPADPVHASYHSLDHREHQVTPDVVAWDPENMKTPMYVPSQALALRNKSGEAALFGPDQNGACHCGSGKRYRRCHGRGLFDPRRLAPMADRDPTWVSLVRFASEPIAGLSGGRAGESDSNT
jgi:hypothetical protein